MATASDANKYLEKDEIIDDTHDKFQYEGMPEEQDLEDAQLDENLEDAARAVREAQEDTAAAEVRATVPKPSLVQKPEVVEDFVRNFLVRMGMTRSMDCFEHEWYELQEQGLLPEECVKIVPDVFTQNSMQGERIRILEAENAKFRAAALKAEQTHVKLRKDRDYHRMNHKRVAQDKNKVIEELKRMKQHYAKYDDSLTALQAQYDEAIKEKMMVTLEKDRALGQLAALQASKTSVRVKQPGGPGAPEGCQHRYLQDERSMGPTQRTLLEERRNVEALKELAQGPSSARKNNPQDSQFPIDTRVNPDFSKRKPGQVTRTAGFTLSKALVSHKHAVSGLALHPSKQILASASDDCTWKIWSLPSAEVILSGEGHGDFVSDVDFHPSGSCLATSSGDGTVKIWDLTETTCRHTFTEHATTVWGVSFHSCGDFLATGSMDNTAKVWDLCSLRCRVTLRGHEDCVNSVQFLVYSNTLLTASADKTLMLWDVRMRHKAHSIQGHEAAVNHAIFNAKGNTLASCDSKGEVRIWDVRMIATIKTLDVGPEPANKVSFNPTETETEGATLAIASGGGSVYLQQLSAASSTSLARHDEAVLCVAFHPSGDFLASSGNDGTVRIWA